MNSYLTQQASQKELFRLLLAGSAQGNSLVKPTMPIGSYATNYEIFVVQHFAHSNQSPNPLVEQKLTALLSQFVTKVTITIQVTLRDILNIRHDFVEREGYGTGQEAIKKGSTANATPWGLLVQPFGSVFFARIISLRATSTIALMLSPAFAPISSIWAKASTASLRLDSSLFSPFSLSWRRAISPRMAVTMNPALLSPSFLTASIPSKTSCGIRAVTDCDFALVEPVAMRQYSLFWCKTVYIKTNYTKALMCKPLAFIFNYTLSTDKEQDVHIATPRSAGTLSRRLTKPLNEVTIMACLKSTQTHPKFQYRFLALNRHDKKSKPCRLSVEATTEHEARRILAPHFILSFAARLPVQGYGDITTPSTIEKTSTVQEVHHA